MDPATILAAIGIGETVFTYVSGVIERHKAGIAPTADEVAKLLSLQNSDIAAKAADDAADAGLDAAINEGMKA